MSNEIVERKMEWTPEQWGMVKEQAQTLVDSGLLPKTIDTPEKAIVTMMKSQELGIGTMEGFSSLYVVHGKVSMDSQLMLALIMRSGLLEDYKVEQTPTSCTVTMKRKGISSSQSRTWDYKRAKNAGLVGSTSYKKHLPTMLQWRAVAEVGRALFPDIILGGYTPDEMSFAGVKTWVEEGNIVLDDIEIEEAEVIDDEIHRDTLKWWTKLQTSEKDWNSMKSLMEARGYSALKNTPLSEAKEMWKEIHS